MDPNVARQYAMHARVKKMTWMHVFPMKILLVDLIQSHSRPIMIAPTTAQPCIDKFQLIKLAEKLNKQKSI